MNPIGINYERFLVAEDGNGELVGFAQAEEKTTNDGSDYLEFRSLFVKKEARFKWENCDNPYQRILLLCQTVLDLPIRIREVLILPYFVLSSTHVCVAIIRW